MKILVPVFLFGALALGISLHPYQPFDAGSMLLGVFAICITALGILVTADKDEHINAMYLLAALLPWLLASALVVNGALDRSPETLYHTVVIKEHFNRKWMDSIVVRSWRPGRATESVYVRGYNGFYDPGEGVTVGIKPGVLGIAWVSSVSRDRYSLKR